MAVYKRDIADINLETGNIHRTFLNHSIGLKDQQADHFGVRVFRDGEPVNLSGVSVQGVFMPPQGSPIAITSGNIVSGNVAEVVLPQACYNYDGQFCLAIKLVDATNSVTGTVRIVDGMVDNTHASGTVAPTSAVPTYQEVLSVYEQAIAAISTVNAMAGKMAVDITAGAEATSNNSFKDLGNRWMTFRRGYYSTPSAGSTSSYTDDVNYVYALVACAPGDVLHAHGYGDGTSKSAWAFLDSSLKILDRGGSGNYEGTTDPAPTSTAFALVNVKLASLGSGYYGWTGPEAIKDQIATLKDAVSEDGNIIYSRDLKSAFTLDTEDITGAKPLIFESGGYYQTSSDGGSATYTTNAGAACASSNVAPGDIVVINAGAQSSTARLYVFTDSQNKTFGRSGANLNGRYVVKVPANATKIFINNIFAVKASGYYAYVGKTLKDVLTIIDNMQNEESNIIFGGEYTGNLMSGGLTSGYYSGSGSVTPSSALSHIDVNVSGVKSVKISGTIHDALVSSMNQLCVFFDGNGDKVLVVNNRTEEPYMVDVPAGAVTLGINTNYKASDYPSSLPEGMYCSPYVKAIQDNEIVYLRDLSQDRKKLRILAGVIRNNGTGWDFINDDGHEPINLASVELTEGGSIVVNYGFTASMVLSLVACPDETFAKQYTIGGSVADDKATFNVYELPHEIGGLVKYDYANSTWVLGNSSFTNASFDSTTGALTLTHESVGGLLTKEKYNVHAQGRLCDVYAGRVTDTSVTIYFRDENGDIMKSFSEDMYAYVTRFVNARFVDANNIVNANGNFWIYGVMEL